MRLLTIELLLMDDDGEDSTVDQDAVVQIIKDATDKNYAVITDWRVAPAKIVVGDD